MTLDERLKEISREYGAGLLTDTEYEAKYEAVDAQRTRPNGMTRAGGLWPPAVLLGGRTRGPMRSCSAMVARERWIETSRPVSRISPAL
jgi:hypothetical protein